MVDPADGCNLGPELLLVLPRPSQPLDSHFAAIRKDILVHLAKAAFTQDLGEVLGGDVKVLEGESRWQARAIYQAHMLTSLWGHVYSRWEQVLVGEIADVVDMKEPEILKYFFSIHTRCGVPWWDITALSFIGPVTKLKNTGINSCFIGTWADTVAMISMQMP